MLCKATVTHSELHTTTALWSCSNIYIYTHTQSLLKVCKKIQGAFQNKILYLKLLPQSLPDGQNRFWKVFLLRSILSEIKFCPRQMWFRYLNDCMLCTSVLYRCSSWKEIIVLFHPRPDSLKWGSTVFWIRVQWLLNLHWQILLTQKNSFCCCCFLKSKLTGLQDHTTRLLHNKNKF